MAKEAPLCRLCDHRHWTRQPHVLIGGPTRSKDVQRLARNLDAKPRESRLRGQASQIRSSGFATTNEATKPEQVTISTGPMTEAEARDLTDRIKSALDDLEHGIEEIGSMLAEAHERGSWKNLGYSSWNRYVEAEFQMSKRHANRLVAHEHFVAMLEAGSNLSGTIGPTPALTEGETRMVRSDPVAVKQVKKLVKRGVSPKAAVARVAVDKATGAPCGHPRTVSVLVCADCGHRIE